MTFSPAYANLHMHSTYSDACFTPEQLVIIGKSMGHYAMALTDHETDGGVKRFIRCAQAHGMKALPGVEFYGKLPDGRVPHLVALDFDMDDPGLRAHIKKRCDDAREETRWCVQRGIDMGYIENITWNDILDHTDEGAWMCTDSVMNAMRELKCVPHDFDWDAFRANVFKCPEAKKMRKQFKAPLAEDVIRIVRKAGGVIILAHPVGYMDCVEYLVDCGLNGIEISHPQCDAEVSALAIEAAEKFHLYRSGGTDHFGALGGNDGKFAIPVFNGISEEDFVTLTERRLG